MSNNKDDQHVRPEVICDALEKCLSMPSSFDDDNDSGSLPLVVMNEYLRAYKELSRFFHSLGVIFSFVAKDVDAKIHILESYRSDPTISLHYETFQSMIKFEDSENLLKDPKRPSGSRTVLRLHRALLFFSMFMKELAKVPGSDGSGDIAREVYKKTLAPYHSWFIQKSASLAMYKLPTRDTLIARSFGHDKDKDYNSVSDTKTDTSNEDDQSTQSGETGHSNDSIEEWKKQSDEMIRLGQLSRQVYDVVQQLIHDNNLLDLP